MSINQNIDDRHRSPAGQTMPGTIDQKIEVKVTPAKAKVSERQA